MTKHSFFWAVYRRRKAIEAKLFVFVDGTARLTDDVITITNKDKTRVTDAEIGDLVASGLLPTIVSYPNPAHRAGKWVARLPNDGPEVLGTIVQ